MRRIQARVRRIEPKTREARTPDGPLLLGARKCISTLYDTLDQAFGYNLVNEWERAYQHLQAFEKIIRNYGYQLDKEARHHVDDEPNPLRNGSTKESIMIRRNNRPQRRHLADRVAEARRNTIRKERFARDDERVDALRERIASLKAELRRAEREEYADERPSRMARRRPLERQSARTAGRFQRPERPARERPMPRRPILARRVQEVDERREERLAALRERLETERRREQRLAMMRRRAAAARRRPEPEDERPRRRRVKATTEREAAPKFMRATKDIFRNGKLLYRKGTLLERVDQ